MMRTRLAIGGCLLATVFGTALFAAEQVRVLPLARDGKVFVSFEIPDAFTTDIQEAIHSGLATSFTYDVDLRRGTSLWMDRTLASATITASVRYDNLTRQHHLSRMVDGRVDASRVTADKSDVARWLTSVDHLELFRTANLETNGEYYVRVRARTYPRTAWFWWPWERLASGHASFTFIP